MRVLLLTILCCSAASASEAVTIGDFESGRTGWSFSNGAEFPGAAGSLDCTREAARSGSYGAHLRFDFRKGGAYVAMYYTFSKPVTLARFRFSLRKPSEATVTLRVTDATGQTVQKSCRFEHGDWQTVSVRMGGWAGHWGGANDGRVHQPVGSIGILIEARPGQFRWDFYDRMVATARRNGIEIYGLLAYWSGWAAAYTPEGIDAYARWAAAVVRRYRDKIHHWEVWNEPNIFFWQGPRDLYAELLKKTYTAIKREDPRALVLGLSTAGIDTRFIRHMLKLQAPFDILTIHPYRAVLAEKALMQELRDVKSLVGGRPVWITEMGWPTQLGGTDEAAQARLLARTYLAAAASGALDNALASCFADS